jgi:hypothetical protein
MTPPPDVIVAPLSPPPDPDSTGAMRRDPYIS